LWSDLEASWRAEAFDRPDADLSSQGSHPKAAIAAGSGYGADAVAADGTSGKLAAAADDDGPVPSEPDVGKPEERFTSVVEQCLAWGGEQRLRLQVTLSTAGASVAYTIHDWRLLLNFQAAVYKI
jgi:hypothetical protein